MLYKLIQYLTIVFLVILAFSQSFHLILSSIDNSYTYPNVLMTLYLIFIGNSDYTLISQSGMVTATILFVMISLTGYVLLFNLLISTMTHAYDQIEKDVSKEILLSRADVVKRFIEIHAFSDKEWEEKIVKKIFFPIDKGNV